MRAPHLYYVPELIRWGSSTQTCHPEAGWIPARPIPYYGMSLRQRLSLAWAVFTGKYDAVYWEPTLRDLRVSANEDLNNTLKAARLAAAGENVRIFTEPAMVSNVLALTTASPAMQLPEKVDLSPAMPSVEDQGALNAASACAITAAFAATPLDLNNVGCLPLVYYNERASEEKS
jgi:hypothetical protein